MFKNRHKAFTPLEIAGNNRCQARSRKFFTPLEIKKFLTGQAGFTLIELLVVIAVIGLLATIVVVSVNNARAKARDTKRRSDLKQVSTALELYYDANNSVYPSTGGAWWGTCSIYGGHPTSGATGWVPNLAPTWMSTLPTDPKPVGDDGCYLYRSNGTDYKVIAHHTIEQNCPPIPTSDPMYDPPRSPTQCTIGIFTFGARNW